MKMRICLSPASVAEGNSASTETLATPEKVSAKTESQPEHLNATAEDDVLWFAE